MSIVYSIIIPTYNRDESLAKCLSHIEQMKIPQANFEVLVMDNGTDEKSHKKVETFYTKMSNLKYYPVKSPGLHVCRNLGYEKAQGKILCYLDDDSFVEPTWLQGVEEAFSKTGVALVGGKILPDFEIDPPQWIDKLWRYNQYGKYISYYSILDFGDDDFYIPAEFIWGCNFSIRKEILLECGGFHPDSFPANYLPFRGDGESAVARFIDKKKYLAYYSAHATVQHLVSAERLTIDYLYHRSYKQGISDSYSLLRRQKGSLTNSLIRLYYWRSRYWIKKFSHLIKNVKNPLKKVLDKGYWDGFRFHLNLVKQNPGLIDWILKADYFGEKGTHLEQYDL